MSSSVRFRPAIAALAAYRQGKPAPENGFKLSSNENPFEPHPAVLAAITAATDIHRYPDATASRLRAALATRHGVSVDEVHVGAGSVAILAQLMIATSGAGDEVLHSWRSFEAYPLLITHAGATSRAVPNAADGSHDLAAMAAAITERTRLILVCSPNNPTGPAVSKADFANFMRLVPNDVLVVLDEAYAEFVTDPDAVDGAALVGRYPNLAVLRTFSKAFGLAGLRVGYLVASPEIVTAAAASAIPLSVTAAAEAGALAALAHEDELLARVRELAQRRDAFRNQLVTEQGWRIPQAQGNFVWLASGDHAVTVAEALFDRGIVARPFVGEGVRISIGEAEAMELAAEVLSQFAHTTAGLGIPQAIL